MTVTDWEDSIEPVCFNMDYVLRDKSFALEFFVFFDRPWLGGLVTDYEVKFNGLGLVIIILYVASCLPPTTWKSGSERPKCCG